MMDSADGRARNVDGAGAVRAAIVTVGEELLYGETVDTNAAWLGRELTLLGIPVARRFTVGDADEEIRFGVGAGMKAADVVVVSGGLGPTRDDRTRDAVAALLGLPVREDADLLAALERRFLTRGYPRMPDPNRSQARVPEGARVLPNRHGTAPGLALSTEGPLVVLLPGVPRELRGLFEDEVRPLLLDRFSSRLAPIRHRVLHTSGVPESRLSELVEEVLPADLGPVSLAFLPDALGVDLRITVRGVVGGEADAWLDRMEATLGPAIERWRFEAPSGDLAIPVVEAIRARGATLAVAESCTGGLLSHRITRIAGVSDVFLGGVVAYANAAKTELLGVPDALIGEHGAVSEEVARAMALGVARRCGATFGVGITGIAGPAGGSEEKPVGTVWTAVSYGEEVVTRLGRFPGDREGIQARAAQDALRLLAERARSAGGTPER